MSNVLNVCKVRKPKADRAKRTRVGNTGTKACHRGPYQKTHMASCLITTALAARAG